jgi:GT2 family glycosyltransferase
MEAQGPERTICTVPELLSVIRNHAAKPQFFRSTAAVRLMKISVIIPVGRDVAGLVATLQSIGSQHWDYSAVEVIVCNDGGGTEISSVIAQFGCREARLDVNRGSYAARNAGIRIARGRAFAFLDADEIITQEWLGAGAAALETADYVGGRILVPASPESPFWERVDAAFAFPVAFYLQRRRYAPTANLFVRRSVFEALGGFDEALTSGGDREFGTRVARSNLVQQYCAEATVFHPARNLREQLRKIRRTSRGNAALEIMLWGRPAILFGARAIAFALGKLCHAAILAIIHALSPRRVPPADTRLLAAGRAAMDACYYLSLGAQALRLAFRRRTLRSRIPSLAPAG